MPTPVQPPNARGLTAPPPPPLRAPEARADARREYTAAAAGGLYLDANYLGALPPYIDDVTRRMGGGTYEQMLKDECVHSAFKTVVLSVLSEGVNVRPCVDDKDDKDFDTAKGYADECVAAFDQGGEGGDGLDLEHLASELLYSLATGWVAAEKVVGVLDGGRYDGLQCWESVRAKPRRNVTPVVDPFDRVHGYLCRMPGRALSQLQGQVVGDPTRLPNYLPADKFVHAAWDVREHDPRGQSILRPVYTRWYEKQQVAAEWLKHLAQFGSPWVVGKTAPGTQGLPAVDTLGNATGDASDNVTPEQAFLNQILLFRNGGAIVVPAGWELNLLQVSSAKGAFGEKIDACDRAITQGITLQTLATTEGEHQARAAAQVHQDTLGLVPGWVRRWLARLLTRSLVRPLVRMNHGDAAVLLAPLVKLEAAQQEDRAKLITAYAGAGWKFAPSQLPAVDEELGFEPRTPEEAQPPPPPVPPPGAPPGGRPGAPPAPGTPPGKPAVSPAAFAFDPDEPRDESGKWTAGGGGSALDRPIGARGNTFRQFYESVHNATEERPAAPAFHDPFRRRVDDALLALAGPNGGRLFWAHHSGAFTVVVSGTHYAHVASDPDGRNITLDSSDTAVKGPSPRESHYVPLHAGMSDHELNYRLARALGVKVPREDRLKYDAADKAARAEGRERLGREKAERTAAREARRAERAARRGE